MAGRRRGGAKDGKIKLLKKTNSKWQDMKGNDKNTQKDA
jgi:hypothetical protein